MAITIGDKNSALFTGLSSFWQRFFRDTADLEAFYQSSEVFAGQAYLDLMAAVLNLGIVDTPVFNKEYWKLFAVDETEIRFVEGASVAEDRYVYDMPGATVTVDFLQNTIFSPDVLLERGVDFDVADNDGYVRFHSDPFMQYQDDTGEWLPIPGTAWRTVSKEVGNQLTDRQRATNWVADTDIKKGDTLRLLAQRGVQLQTGTTGAVTIGFGVVVFTDTNVGLMANPGDIIQIYNAGIPDTAFNGYYVVKERLNDNQVRLDNTAYAPTVASSTPLQWTRYKGLTFPPFYDFEVNYFEGQAMIGSSDNPYPIGLSAPFVYAVVRQPADDQVLGAPVSFYPTNTDLNYRHIVPGSLRIYAHVYHLAGDDPSYTVDGFYPVKEGLDYTVDYWHGIIYPLNLWDATSYMTCDFQYRTEVFFSAGGDITSKAEGRVKQVALWTPEVLTDRFTLWYNYGSFLNRFEASSETYKAFLRGVMYLYTTGPILERIEAAMDVAAGYPVVKNDGEILQSYDNGENGSGIDGSITGPPKYFTTPSFSFSELDIGGYIIISGAVNAVNNGRFRINAVISSDTVELESSYPMVTEPPPAPLTWVLTRSYKKTVTTDQRDYEFPYNVPVRDDVQDPVNFGVLTFIAFESLTLAFRVTDYVEDPNWWHNKYIPKVLWDESVGRRYASTQLFPNIITPADELRIGDPGFFIGADDEQRISATPFRHSTAFILFDRYLKFHMFYVDIDSGLELDEVFLKDLRDIILVTKPSYTYPYVTPSETFEDICGLEEDFWIGNIGLHWGPYEEVQVVDNVLRIGDTKAPWAIGSYYRYYQPFADFLNVDLGIPSPPAGPFVLPVNILPALPEQRPLSLIIQATVGGIPVREGTDYWVDWRAGSPTQWTIFPLTTWDAALTILVDLLVLEFDNIGYHVFPDVPATQDGLTPYAIGGLNPGVMRPDIYDAYPPALDWAALRTGLLDRALELKVNADTGVPGGVPYTYG